MIYLAINFVIAH